ncbi:MAG: hypothetical protein IJ167_12215 [Lachnospiraceae bacterium]|nr:hypothetical protein [Lachnospiraceae bacterium]MBQ9608723.1 hypothetical protein [Lachnospiraceae bacterium]
MPYLEIDKNKQSQKTETADQYKDATLETNPKMQEKNNSKVIGRDMLIVPVPKEAREKSLTGKAKKLFGFSDKKVGDYYDNYKAKGAHGKDNTPVVDLSKEERHTDSEKWNDFVWADIKKMVEETKATPQYNGYGDFTKTIIDKIEAMTQDNMKDNRVNLQAEIMYTLRDVYDSYKVMEFLDDKNDIQKNYDAIKKRYKDPEVLLSFAAILIKKTSGDLKIEDADKIIDKTDDSFFETKVESIKPPINIGNVLCDKRSTGFKDNYSDWSNVPLFTDEPNIEDVAQGDIGDCYMLAGLSALINKDPQLIKSAMKDEGKTVVVRFYSLYTGKPYYVRVKKTIPYHLFYPVNSKDKNASIPTALGSTGAFWVKIFEKAYAVARRKLEGSMTEHPEYMFRKGYDMIRGGSNDEFIKVMTGKKINRKTLGVKKKSVKIETLFSKVHYGEKDAFMKERKEDGSKKTALDWNIRKAKLIFGLDVDYKNVAVYNAFRKNRVFDKYEAFMKKHFSNNFKTEDNSGGNPTFSSIQDLNMFLDSIDTAQMPDLKLGQGIDEERLKRNYIEYFRNSIIASGILKNTVKTDGEYTAKENEVYSRLSKANPDEKGIRKLVTASTGVFTLQYKSNSKMVGACGEHVVNGLAATHAYTVLGTKEKTTIIKGKPVTQRFVMLRNPWGSDIVRNYNKDMEQAGNDLIRRKGIFLMELRDFCESFSSYEFE